MTEAPERTNRTLQLQRALQVQLIQSIQVLLQRLVIAPRLRERDDGRAAALSPVVDLLFRLHAVRALPARVFGLGIRREHVTVSAA
jgi:hypothetical protein